MMSDSNKTFSRDVKRTMILGAYIRNWGMPKNRRIISKTRKSIELYNFPSSQQSGNLERLATVGVSDAFDQGAGESGVEVFFAWQPDPSVVTTDEIEDLVLDVAVHIFGAGIKEYGTVLDVARKPQALDADRVLLDEPLTERKSLAKIP